MWRRCAAIAGLLGLVASACAPGAATLPTPVAPGPLQESHVPPETKAAVEAALADAASHLGVARDQLRVDSVTARQWGDSSLGCPSPELLYSQVVTPGFLILITNGARQLEYHTDARGRVVL